MFVFAQQLRVSHAIACKFVQEGSDVLFHVGVTLVVHIGIFELVVLLWFFLFSCFLHDWLLLLRLFFLKAI